MNFEILALVTAISTLLLGMGRLFAGKFLLQRWGIEPTDTSLLLGRRIGAMYIGIALIFFLVRSAPPSDFRSALCAGALVICLLWAGLGLYEYNARRLSSGVLSSVAIEVFLAVGFAAEIWTHLTRKGS
jgi:drug/metabolite transporter (DMT)-like permease